MEIAQNPKTKNMVIGEMTSKEKDILLEGVPVIELKENVHNFDDEVFYSFNISLFLDERVWTEV
jgi:hypothetical protein